MKVNLIMFKTNGQQKSIPVTKPRTILGRGLDCDLRIPIESCSRRQCQMTITDEEVRLKDLGSSNGTFVNNTRVSETVLRPGDKITIGPITMTVQINGVPAEIKESPSAMANMDDVGGELVSGGGGSSHHPLMDDLVGAVGGGENASAEDDPFSTLSASDKTAGGVDDPLAALESLADMPREDQK